MIRRSSRIQRLVRVLAGAAILQGCTAHPVDPPGPGAGGPVTVRPGRAGFVVAVPRGTADPNTDEMAAEIARRTGFGLVLASGASAEEDEQRVLAAARGPLRFYAEIQGHDRASCAGPIEIATVGVDRELAVRLRALAELIRDAHLRASQEVQRLDVLVEPADAVSARSSAAKREGVLRLPERALHIELPKCARRDWREAYTSILADFLAEAVTLPVGR
jgi:hypothetical protein